MFNIFLYVFYMFNVKYYVKSVLFHLFNLFLQAILGFVVQILVVMQTNYENWISWSFIFYNSVVFLIYCKHFWHAYVIYTQCEKKNIHLGLKSEDYIFIKALILILLLNIYCIALSWWLSCTIDHIVLRIFRKVVCVCVCLFSPSSSES